MTTTNNAFVAKNGLIVNTNLIYAVSGQVAIGNTTPDANLMIQGTANVRGALSVTGITSHAANVTVTGSVNATSNVIAPTFFGNVAATTVNATANVIAPTFYGNVSAITVNASANVIAPTFFGNIVAGFVSASSNVSVGTIGAGSNGFLATPNTFQLGNTSVYVNATPGALTVTGLANVGTLNTTTANATTFNGNVSATTVSASANVVTPTVYATILNSTTVNGNTVGQHTGNVSATVVNATTVNATSNVYVGGSLNVAFDATFSANLNVAGNLNITGSISSVGTSNVSGNTIPSATATYYLGNTTQTFATLYTNNVVLGNTLTFASINSTSYTGTSYTANNSTYLGGQNSSFYTNATNISTGVLPYAQLGVNVVNTTGSFTISGTQTHTGNVVLGSVGLSANLSYGVNNQVLHSNGTATYWAHEFANATANGISVTSGAISVSPSAGLGVNSSGVYVLANSGIIANSLGVFVNTAYVGSTAGGGQFANATNGFGINGSANNASFLLGQTWGTPGPIGTGAANTAAFTQIANYGTYYTNWGGAAIVLQNTGPSYISFLAGNTTALAGPTNVTSSPGTKLLLYPSANTTAVDYAIGLAPTGVIWFSLASNTFGKYSFYGGTTEFMWSNTTGLFHTGYVNAAAIYTGSLTTANAGVTSYSGSNTAIYGNSNNGTGVFGSTNNSAAAGVSGQSTGGVGVIGQSTTNFGLYGLSVSSYGVYGLSNSSAGVYGTSNSGTGAYALSITGTGLIVASNTSTGMTVTSNFGTANIAVFGNNSAVSQFINSSGSYVIGTLNSSNVISIGSAMIANQSGVYSTGTVNAATHSSGAGFTANSTLVNAAAVNVSGQVNAATLYATTSANIASTVIANSQGLTTSANVTALNVNTSNMNISNNITVVGQIVPSSPFMFRNRLGNGLFTVDQKNYGASNTAVATYTVDRWKYGSTIAGKFTYGQSLLGETGAPGFINLGCQGFQSSSSYSPAASDSFTLYQTIEGYQMGDFNWGQASARPVTLSFWAKASLTGTYGGCINNTNATTPRSYVFQYTITVANTWQYFAITIPGDTAGTWVQGGIGFALNVAFDVGSGSNYNGTANTWSTGSTITRVAGNISPVSTSGATWYITAVQLELGSLATPFEKLPYEFLFVTCQRYYQVIPALASAGYASAGGQAVTQMFTWQGQMRTSPTISGLGSAVVTNCTLIPYFQSGYGFGIIATSVAAGILSYSASNVTVSCEI